MEAGHGRQAELRVFVCEDQDRPEQYQQEFDAVARSPVARKLGWPPLRIVHHEANMDRCLDLLGQLDWSGDSDAPSSPFRQRARPHLVLVDDRLRRGSAAKPQQSALDFMQRLPEMVGDHPLPRCVLWTSTPDPDLWWAFRVLGGRHVVHKPAAYWPDRIATLYAVALQDAVWWPERPAFHLEPAARRLLPYFGAGLDLEQTAAALGVPTVEAAKDTFRNAVRAYLRETTGENDVHLPQGETALAHFARQHGWLWVPYDDLHRVPDDAPLPAVLDPRRLPAA